MVPIHARLSNRPLAAVGGIQLCMYWILGMHSPLFHLSNVMMTKSIEIFEDAINSPGNFMKIPTALAFERVSPELLSKLVDSPVFNYYLTGKTATSALGTG
jgi:hypothetical protein